jgi:hypothetical protein
MLTDPFVLFLLIIAGAFSALEIYLAYLNFTEWLRHKTAILAIGLALLKSKNKEIKKLGWDTIKLFFWETKDDEKCSTDKDKE